MLRRIAALYAIEEKVLGTSAEQRRTVRAEQARVIEDDLHTYLEARLRQVSAKNRLADAIRYALARWSGLSLFLEDGRVELDSNTVELSIRPLALNRNYAKRWIMRRCWRQTPKLRRGRRHELHIIRGTEGSSTGCRKRETGRARRCVAAASSVPFPSSRGQPPRTCALLRCPRAPATGQ